jgi:CHAD domain-containing protein
MAKAPRYGDIGPDEPLEVLSKAVLRALWGGMLAESPAALGGDDVEAIHDMRVAIRRLRNALRTFRDAHRGKGLKRIAKSTRRLGRTLGGVRDADVHLAVLRSALTRAPGAERDGIAYAIEQVGEQRGRALAQFAIVLAQFDRDALEPALVDG